MKPRALSVNTPVYVPGRQSLDIRKSQLLANNVQSAEKSTKALSTTTTPTTNDDIETPKRSKRM